MGTNRVLYAAPTKDQMMRFWNEATIALSELIEGGIYRRSESEMVIEQVGTERRIRAKTAWNAESLRGDYGDLIILDEYQLMNEDALQEVIYPMLIDNNGDLVLIYTPPSLHAESKGFISKATDKRHAAKMFQKFKNDPRWLCLHFTTHDNPHVSREGIEEIARDMSNLSFRQEILAEDLDEVPGALWTHALIEQTRVTEHPPLNRIVVGIDPPGGATECGIVAAALGADGHGYVLKDESMRGSPKEWAARATWTYYELDADRILGEQNYGGEMVEMTVKMHDENISYKSVNATRGKLVRAEPIEALYEKGVIHHVGVFPQMEEEMCSYVPGQPSPNRMDALVWALTELFPENRHYAVIQSVQQLAEEQRKQEAERRSVSPTGPGSPVNPNPQSGCPACGSSAIVKRGPITHCNQCGENWGQVRHEPDENERKPRANLFNR